MLWIQSQELYMPIFNDYSETGKLLSTRNEMLTEKNVERYIAEHGQERLDGYLDCVRDILTYFQENLNLPIGVRKNLYKLWNEREDFLNSQLPDDDTKLEGPGL
jgi:hypothetical protein